MAAIRFNIGDSRESLHSSHSVVALTLVQLRDSTRCYVSVKFVAARQPHLIYCSCSSRFAAMFPVSIRLVLIRKV